MDRLPSVNNKEMKEGGIHVITEEFIGLNDFMVAKQGLWSFYTSVRNLALLERGYVCMVPY